MVLCCCMCGRERRGAIHTKVQAAQGGMDEEKRMDRIAGGEMRALGRAQLDKPRPNRQVGAAKTTVAGARICNSTSASNMRGRPSCTMRPTSKPSNLAITSRNTGHLLICPCCALSLCPWETVGKERKGKFPWSPHLCSIERCSKHNTYDSSGAAVSAPSGTAPMRGCFHNFAPQNHT